MNCAFLQSLLLRATAAVRAPSAQEETSLGVLVYLARMASSRIYEAWKGCKQNSLGRLSEELWTSVPKAMLDQPMRDRGVESARSLNRALSRNDSLLKKIRNRLGFHLEAAALDAGFSAMPSDVALTEFHTGRSGSTFFGAADTVTVYTICELTAQSNALAGIGHLVDELIIALSWMQDVVDGYMYPFTVVYIGAERLTSMERQRIDFVPRATDQPLTFFVRTSVQRKAS